MTFAFGVFTGSYFELTDLSNRLPNKNEQEGFTNPNYRETVKPESKPVFSTKEMRQQLSKVRGTLSDYYGNFSDMLAAATPPHLNYKDEKYKKVIEYHSENILESLLNDGKYTVGVIGSSVAAGHDNCAYDSYENQMQRTLSDIWSIDGLNGLEVLNAGMGGGCGDTHENQVYCVQHTLGNNVDIVHYSWTYFEHREMAPVQHEQIVRWSLMLRNQPATLLFNAGGTPGSCIDEKAGKNKALFEKYHGYGYSGLCLETLLFANGHFAGKEWGNVGDGVHNVTRYGVSETGDRKESLGVVFRNWHPGPLGFQAVADAFAWLHLDALEIALDRYDKGEENNMAVLTAKDIGDPLYCEDECEVDSAPNCMNLESPTFGQNYMKFVHPSDDLSPYYERQSELMQPENYAPLLQPHDKYYEVPKQEADIPGCQHQDHCGYIQLNGATEEILNKWIVIQLPRMEAGFIALCGCCKKDVGQAMFIDNDALEIEFDGKRLDNSKFELWPARKCAKILDGFPKDVKDESGHLYLALRVNKKLKDDVLITSIIAV